jgi:hypothetical protein
MSFDEILFFQYDMVCRSGYLSTEVNFKLLGLLVLNGAFLLWYLGLTYATFIMFHSLRPFDFDHQFSNHSDIY